MGILEDLRVLNVNAQDPAAAAAGIRNIALDPNTRVQLAREWEQATGQTMAPAVFATLES